MSIDEVAAQLGFAKVDFHVHTPVSACYEDHISPHLNLNTQPEDIVRGALDANLRAMVVTDHNSGANIQPMREAARGTGLIIFPGMEITTQGGHLLTVFEQDTSVAILERLLDRLGFSESQRGDGVCSTGYWLDEVAQMVEDFGGLALAAHVDRDPRGFIAGPIPKEVKQRIHQSDHLSALEITDPRYKSQWNQGLMRYYPKPYACIQGSDAHAPKEVGRRPTFLILPALELGGLRRAFYEYGERVRFPSEFQDGADG